MFYFYIHFLSQCFYSFLCEQVVSLGNSMAPSVHTAGTVFCHIWSGQGPTLSACMQLRPSPPSESPITSPPLSFFLSSQERIHFQKSNRAVDVRSWWCVDVHTRRWQWKWNASLRDILNVHWRQNLPQFRSGSWYLLSSHQQMTKAKEPQRCLPACADSLHTPLLQSLLNTFQWGCRVSACAEGHAVVCRLQWFV